MNLSYRNLFKNRVTVIASIVLLTAIGGCNSSASPEENPKELIDEVWQLTDRLYIDPTFSQVDWMEVRTDYLDRSYRNEEEVYIAIREMLAKLDDPQTLFFEPDEFTKLTEASYAAVTLPLLMNDTNQEWIISTALSGLAIFKAGIQPGDVLVSIDGISVKGMDILSMEVLLKGAMGSELTLTVRRAGQEKTFSVLRDQVEIPSVYYEYRSDAYAPFGYIRLLSLDVEAIEAVKQAIFSLETQVVEGYILDVRSNPGGLLDASVEIAEMWMNEGAIIATFNGRGGLTEAIAREGALTDKPLVILIDRGASSGAEILAAALQFSGRATVVGTSTHGYGQIQTVRPLGNGAGLSLTTATVLTPDGQELHGRGITPDEIVELADDELRALWEEFSVTSVIPDSQYTRAVEILQNQITGP